MYELKSMQFWSYTETDPDEPPAYLEGLLPLPGLSVLLGRNSAGKTSLLEAVEQALTDDWFGERETGRGSYRAHLSQELRLHIRPFPTTTEAFAEAVSAANDEATGQRLKDWIAESEHHGLELYFLGNLVDIGAWSPDGRPDRGSSLGELSFENAIHLLPRPVAIAAEVGDLNRHAAAATRQVVASWFGLEGGLDYFDRTAMSGPRPPSEPVHLPPGLVMVLNELGKAASDLLPDFLNDIRIELLVADFPLLFHGEPLIQLRLVEPSGGSLHPDQVGTGARRWVGAALDLASERLCASRLETDDIHEIYEAWHGGGSVELRSHDERPIILLVDEPELHLHPRATRSVIRWLSERLNDLDVAAAITATHAPELLRVPTRRVATVLLDRRPDATYIVDLGSDLLAGLEHHAVAAGLELSTWLHAVRGVLLVEGEHDRMVVESFFDKDLREERVFVLPLRGHRNAVNVAQCEFLGYVGVPLFVLLDNVRADAVAKADSADQLADEDRTAFTILKLREREFNVSVLPYDEPDILCALPSAVLARRYPHVKKQAEQLTRGDGYWGSWINDWRTETETSGNRRSFKGWAAERLGLASGVQLVPDLVSQVQAGDEPSPALRRAMKTMLAELGDRQP